MTCAPRGGARARPPVRLAGGASTPPPPRPSPRSWAFAPTSSPRRAAPRTAGQATHPLIVSLEAIASGARIDRGLDVAVTDLGGERDRLQHLLDQLAELALVVAAGLGGERAALGDDVPGRTAVNLADVRGRLLV